MEKLLIINMSYNSSDKLDLNSDQVDVNFIASIITHYPLKYDLIEDTDITEDSSIYRVLTQVPYRTFLFLT